MSIAGHVGEIGISIETQASYLLQLCSAVCPISRWISDIVKSDRDTRGIAKPQWSSRCSRVFGCTEPVVLFNQVANPEQIVDCSDLCVLRQNLTYDAFGKLFGQEKSRRTEK